MVVVPQTEANQPSAADWMSQWMLSPQHGEKKLRGTGQGMLVVARFADPMYIMIITAISKSIEPFKEKYPPCVSRRFRLALRGRRDTSGVLSLQWPGGFPGTHRACFDCLPGNDHQGPRR